MRTFMKEMTLVIGPYMEQKTRPMEQIMHCKSCSLGHCEGSVDKLRASSVESSPLSPVPEVKWHAIVKTWLLLLLCASMRKA